MMPWTESHVWFVYFTALLISLVIGIMTILYLRSRPILRIVGNLGTSVIWRRSFTTTIWMSALLGALTVSVRDCDGIYYDFVGQPGLTLRLGINEVLSAFRAIISIIWFWFAVLMALRLTSIWKLTSVHLFKLLAGAGLVLLTPL